eukprot:CAMPEP_0170503912 /NCGR_PEP_ID=MMETSP0208-20121228/46321_1 /TAXON_ID=197538 /ORGANISM="Strombidium inclinatum, Strain S3" /LENGTH=192 /DNA_ID=CAMNT_0010783841 /DNA_START=3666 /DNA_END=4243 /DNA_ORIENTATION=-
MTAQNSRPNENTTGEFTLQLESLEGKEELSSPDFIKPGKVQHLDSLEMNQIVEASKLGAEPETEDPNPLKKPKQTNSSFFGDFSEEQEASDYITPSEEAVGGELEAIEEDFEAASQAVNIPDKSKGSEGAESCHQTLDIEVLSNIGVLGRQPARPTPEVRQRAVLKEVHPEEYREPAVAEENFIHKPEQLHP